MRRLELLLQVRNAPIVGAEDCRRVTGNQVGLLLLHGALVESKDGGGRALPEATACAGHPKGSTPGAEAARTAAAEVESRPEAGAGASEACAGAGAHAEARRGLAPAKVEARGARAAGRGAESRASEGARAERLVRTCVAGERGRTQAAAWGSELEPALVVRALTKGGASAEAKATPGLRCGTAEGARPAAEGAPGGPEGRARLRLRLPRAAEVESRGGAARSSRVRPKVSAEAEARGGTALVGRPEGGAPCGAAKRTSTAKGARAASHAEA
mmetsp:Transcript_18676/g.70650  ORF Transcript_18676/g.70650 Transcript_18676/m.70650 type:complete len:272 (+) Transcript_18676:3684-4499(+)